MSACNEPDCSKVLDQVYEYLDGEMGEAEIAQIRVHLEECSPCLQQYDLDVALKALVRRCCQETAPADLRDRIMIKITEARIELNG
ncbi:mycothiol system anti-sigma-R factor [Kineosporia succinea]|uniref:Mycothiol system anti-sigma-R factor n=1 Tax=Kineosporia succinea TaxID=84632 RepID=A0ABT9P5I0_9ACTN|nr:mycothiol system anti-sigma-R factor [Kineosporia succinea]MDP9827445.1 mycothiol system anti-sigma-R factor [Kineosporia succinea]